MPLMFLWLVFDVESGLVDPPRFITAPSWDLGLLLIYNYVAPSSLFKLYFLPEIYNFFFVKDVYNMNQPPRSEGIL
jgi:hypothetical protein